MRIFFIFLLLFSCNNKNETKFVEKQIKKETVVEEKMALKQEINAKTLYMSKCAKCHNADPTKPGSVGPEIANSSFELLEAKTQHRTYPKGYTPKRKTKIMPKILLTKEEIKAIEAFLKR